MLTELLSRIALSETFKYGFVGRLYVESKLHVFEEGDILVEKKGENSVEIEAYYNELFKDSLNFIFPCSIGMYKVKNGDKIEDFSKVEIETRYRRIKFRKE